MPDNSNAEKDLDDEYEQEDLRMTAAELRDLWRSVRGGVAGAFPASSSALREAQGSSPGRLPGEGALLAEESASLHPEEAASPELPEPPAPQPERAVAQQRSRSIAAPFQPGRVSGGGFPAESFSWASFRHHSRWFLPAVLVLLFFMVVAMVSLNGGARLPPQAIGPMFFIFAAIGVLQSCALYYADVNASDTVWVLAVAGGMITFLSATFFALFSTSFALVVTILLLTLGGVLLRRYSLVVRAGTAVVMGRFGKPTRTLYAGFNLRFPGERVLGMVETGQKRCELPLMPIWLRSGEQVKVRVSALYEVIPGEEHLAVRNTKDWRLPIQERLKMVAEDVISMLTAAELRPGSEGNQAGMPSLRAADAEGLNAPLEALNAQLTTTLRERVADRGVAVLAVKAHVVDGPRAPGSARTAPLTASSAHPSLSPHPTLPLPTEQIGTGRAVERGGQALPHYILPPPMITHVAGMPAPSAEGRPTSAREERLSLIPPGGMSAGFSGVTQPPPLLSLRQLEQVYNDVVQQRITDGSTIRRLIAQFDAVAADQVLSEQAPFDAAGAARNLRRYLASLERRASASQAFPPEASEPPLPQVQEPEA